MNCRNINPPSSDFQNERRSFNFDRSHSFQATIHATRIVRSIPIAKSFSSEREGLSGASSTVIFGGERDIF